MGDVTLCHCSTHLEDAEDCGQRADLQRRRQCLVFVHIQLGQYQAALLVLHLITSRVGGRTWGDIMRGRMEI